MLGDHQLSYSTTNHVSTKGLQKKTIFNFHLAFIKLGSNEYMSIYSYWIALIDVSIWAFQHDVPVNSPKDIKKCLIFYRNYNLLTSLLVNIQINFYLKF